MSKNKRITEEVIADTEELVEAEPVEEEVEAEAVKADKKATVLTVNCDALRVRNKPSLEGEIIGFLKNGDAVEVTGGSKDFAYIKYEGKTAYVMKQFLS